MPSRDTLSQSFQWRINAVAAILEAIEPRTHNAHRLRQIANELDRAVTLYGRARVAVVYAAFAELLRTLAMLIEWRAAIFAAEMDADRFLRSALARHRQWEAEYGKSEPLAQLKAAAESIASISVIENVGAICAEIARTPLPVVFTSKEPLRVSDDASRPDSGGDDPAELAVAFLSFLVDGHPADETQFLSPGVVHDLELQVRVSRWPEAAQTLQLTPISIEDPSTYVLPIFQFSRPTGDAPFHLTDSGRTVLKIPQALTARPFEFRYMASFKPDQSEQPIAVVGQRTLRLEGVDLRQNPITGYPNVDNKLLKIRNHLRTLPLITAADWGHVLTILIPLASLAARALHDALYKSITSEAQFQVDVRNELRRWPQIGADLEEHPHAAGGITDLSFHGIRIELKFEDTELTTLKSCERYTAQTASYVVANGKRVGILCVLDNTPKASHALPAEEGIGILIRPTDEGEIYIVTVVIQGNLSRPSDLSR